jgi:hypothetical protein
MFAGIALLPPRGRDREKNATPRSERRPGQAGPESVTARAGIPLGAGGVMPARCRERPRRDCRPLVTAVELSFRGALWNSELRQRCGGGTEMAIGIWAAALLAAAAGGQDNDNSIGRAATQPLRDTRIQEDRIPEVLQLAASAPYSTRGTTSCAAIAAEVARLDAVLGGDADLPGTEPGRGAELAAAATRAAVGSLIPGLGLIRVATGADRQQARVEAAVQAGTIRRSFLKGYGLHRGCAPPAAPTREAREAVPIPPTTGADD